MPARRSEQTMGRRKDTPQVVPQFKSGELNLNPSCDADGNPWSPQDRRDLAGVLAKAFGFSVSRESDLVQSKKIWSDAWGKEPVKATQVLRPANKC